VLLIKIYFNAVYKVYSGPCMPKMMKIILGIMIACVTLITIDFITDYLKRTAQMQTPVSNLCPVGNSSTSFCIVKEGKPYYFAIEGWELPSQEEIESMLRAVETIRDSEGLHVWLKVRTNLELEIDADNNAYVLVGEQYKLLFGADPWLPPIKRGKDVLLIPYQFSTLREDIEALLKAKTVRLYFDVNGYHEVLPTSGCIEKICFTLGRHGSGFYVNFTPPPTILRVLDVEGKRINKELYLYNVTFELREGYLFLYFYYDEATGKKSKADFPVDISLYVGKNGKLLPIDEYFTDIVIPPLPLNAFDVWKEPEHEYVATVIPPGVFTLVFKAYGAIYPEPLFNNTPVAIGTPWGVAKFEPRLEVVEIVNVNGTAYSDEVVIEEVNVVLRNTGKIPAVIPQVCFLYDLPSNYVMLKGKMDSIDLVYVTRDANGRWDRGGVCYLALVVNSGETATVSLTPITSKGFGIELPLESLNHSHVIKIESIYTNASCNMTIPPLTVELSVLNVTKMHGRLDAANPSIKLLISNTWILPIDTNWIKLYLDSEALDTSYYSVPYEEVIPGKSMVIDVRMDFDLDRLYEVLALHEYLRLGIGLSHLNLHLSEFAHGMGEEVVLGNLALKINKISMVDVIGVRQYSYWEGKTVVNCYKAPEGYSILVANIQVRNIGLKSIDIEYIGSDDGVAIVRRGIFELTYLEKLQRVENVKPATIVEANSLWENVELELKPNESSEIVLLFLVPRSTEVRYIVIHYHDSELFIAVFTI